MSQEFKSQYSAYDLSRNHSIPYQVSTISYFEFYRMNIPLFFPGKSLLVSWFEDYNIISCLRRYGHPDINVMDGVLVWFEN